MSGSFVSWSLLIGVNLAIAGAFYYALVSQESPAKQMLVPGTTTHGHYQIEMKCNLCHTEGMDIKQDSCIDCHGAELKESKDTHPASKFNDPTNADRLALLDAQNCLTCHREHVEEQTLDMGLTVPKDYCYHCHVDTLETRPSHKDFAFDSCATSGCHNYHDNRALYENFLVKHAGQEDFLSQATTLLRESDSRDVSVRLELSDIDAPAGKSDNQLVNEQWVTTAHAFAGVNCTGCHSEEDLGAGELAGWSDEVTHKSCEACHPRETEGFLGGRHGMRLAEGLSPMTTDWARQPMHTGIAHKELTCVACHNDHEFDTGYAAVEACLACHNDEHSIAFKETSHFALHEQEIAGELPIGSGVTCATCHMPRLEDEDGHVFVQHNQNANLRPNEKMIREVCSSCHGVAFSIDSLADPELVANCFGSIPNAHIESVDLAKAWFDMKQAKRKNRNSKPK